MATHTVEWQNDFNALVEVMESDFPDGQADVWIEHTSSGPQGYVRTAHAGIDSLFRSSDVSNVTIHQEGAVQSAVSDVVNTTLLDAGVAADVIVGVSVDASNGRVSLDVDPGSDGVSSWRLAQVLSDDAAATAESLANEIQVQLDRDALPSEVAVDVDHTFKGDANRGGLNMNGCTVGFAAIGHRP
ncbi:MAG: hypothetical protein Q4G34_09835 [Micrococcus sp.]|nr:hypothetical protein [Micrococcus sp.]